MEEEKELLIKYPRTYHLPQSNPSSDDKIIEDIGFLEELDHVVVTEKYDGENTTMYRDNIHSRSLDRARHPSRDWVMSFRASIAYKIPKGIRICGENMYAEHSIRYENLPSYFLGFSAWNSENMCLPWDETTDLFQEIGITPVEVLYRGPYRGVPFEELIARTTTGTFEGFVVRVISSIHISDFRLFCGKYVRPNHVQTDEHWLSKPVVPNGLSNSASPSAI